MLRAYQHLHLSLFARAVSTVGFILLGFSCSMGTSANDADNLHQMLATLQDNASDQSTLVAHIDIQTRNRQTQGDFVQDKPGQGSINVRLDGEGLHLIYPPEFLARLDQENLASATDEKIVTPGLNVISQAGASEIRDLLSPARVLMQHLKKAQFKKATPEPLDEQPARRLRFDMWIDNVPEQQRRNLRNFQATLDIWIDDSGIPLASHIRAQGSGRVMVMFGFEFEYEERARYGFVGKRLITRSRDYRMTNSGGNMESERQIKMRVHPSRD